MMLEWRTVTSANDPKYLVRGTVLSSAYVPNCRKRFLIEEVRSQEWDAVDNRHYSSTAYRLRDAETITDADVRSGKSSEIVFRSDDLDLCLSRAVAS